jgi:hypothetical protein
MNTRSFPYRHWRGPRQKLPAAAPVMMSNAMPAHPEFDAPGVSWSYRISSSSYLLLAAIRLVVRIDALTLRGQGSNPLLANYYFGMPHVKRYGPVRFGSRARSYHAGVTLGCVYKGNMSKTCPFG